MKLFLAAFVLFFLNFSFAVVNLNPTGNTAFTATWTTSQTISQSFAVPVAKMVALSFSKTGLPLGTIKLQGSLDNSNWRDINYTTYPDATASVASGTSTAFLSLIANPFPYIRYLFTEGGQGNGTATGRISTK